MTKLFNILKICAKLFLIAIGICGGVMDMVITYPVNSSLYIFYGIVIIVCLLSFMGTFFKKSRKISYIVFGVSLAVYVGLNFIPEISQKFKIDACLDSGRGVWDYDEHRCRTDCYHWSKERGCLK